MIDVDRRARADSTFAVWLPARGVVRLCAGRHVVLGADVRVEEGPHTSAAFAYPVVALLVVNGSGGVRGLARAARVGGRGNVGFAGAADAALHLADSCDRVR